MLRITTDPPPPPLPPVGDEGTTELLTLPLSSGAITKSLGVAVQLRIGELQFIIWALGLMLTMGDCGVDGAVNCGDFNWLVIALPSF